MEANLKVFAKNVRYLRAQKDVKQKEAAEQLKINLKRYQAWENGTAYPKVTMLVKLVVWLHYIDIFKLITQDITPDPQKHYYTE